MSLRWTIGDLDLAGLDRFASLLALLLEAGDTIALTGDLGTGKTTFARLLVGHIAGGPQEITSPTFTLAQRYDAGRLTITHVDCYRLRDAGEAEELGLEDALAEGIVLIEWPERIAAQLPPDRLEIILEDSEDEARRRVSAAGHGGWAQRLERLKALLALLDEVGWSDATVSWMQGDASARSYARLEQDDRSAVLMNAPRRADGPALQDGRSYSAIAHLAEDVRAFVAVDMALREAGLSAPQILAHDLEQGFLLLEDLGPGAFDAAIAAGADEEELYRAAVDVLVALSKHPLPARLPLPGGGFHDVPSYDREALAIETDLLCTWYWRALNGEAAPGPVAAEFEAAWQPLFERLQAEATGWVLRDYHSPNLIWLPEREGVRRVGLIDFQDLVRGPAAYDLVSLAQDARRDISAALEGGLFAHYCERIKQQDPDFDAEAFRTSYAILGAQRATKILGIFARLALRDRKPGYLAHVPRVSAYLERNLAHPALAQVRRWYARHLPAEQRIRLARR
ncbi:MAG: bifunctional tRNA (adenosine(37)-N6)-threonylcarbamoyltransferase complex ATPase subunit type 1 TsaE/phosphotransferase [Methyloligellaceae bacterium]